MERTIAFIIALIMVAVLLCGCGKVDTPDNGHDKRFKEVYSDFDYYIVVDMDTGVEYVVSNSAYNRGTFTMLCDSYGNPYIYPAFDAREDAP